MCRTIIDQFKHLTFAVLTVLLASKHPWAWEFYDNHAWFDTSMDRLDVYEYMPRPFAVFYLLYVARYCSEIVWIFTEKRRKDFPQMLTHHVVALVLMWLSYMNGYSRRGCSLCSSLSPARFYWIPQDV